MRNGLRTVCFLLRRARVAWPSVAIVAGENASHDFECCFDMDWAFEYGERAGLECVAEGAVVLAVCFAALDDNCGGWRLEPAQ